MTEPSSTTLSVSDPAVLRLLEERASVEIQDITTGQVRISVRGDTVDELVSAELTSDRVEVARVAIGKPVGDVLPQVRTEGDVTIVPVFEEVLVVEKRLMLKEELHLRKRSTVEAVSVPVTLRRQTAEVERMTGRSAGNDEPG